MAKLIVPSSFSQQPQRVVQLDGANPLTRKAVLAAAMSLGGSAYEPDLVSSKPWLGTNSSKSFETWGNSILANASAYWQNTTSISTLFGAGDWTVAFLARCTTGSTGVWTAGGAANSGLWIGNNGANWSFNGTVNGAATTSTKAQFVVVTNNSGTVSIYVDKVLGGTGAVGGTFAAGNTTLLNFGPGGAFPAVGHMMYFLALSRGYSAAEVNALTDNPYQIFKAPSRNIWVNFTSTGSSGTVNVTNGNDTSVASGTTTIVGTLVKTNGNDTSVASGSSGSPSSGTLNKTNQNDTSVASGSPILVGTVAKTNTNDSGVASGWSGTITGTVAKTNGNDTSVAIGNSGGFLSMLSRLFKPEISRDTFLRDGRGVNTDD